VNAAAHTTNMTERLTTKLEPNLSAHDPRPAISAYHDMPYAIFRYDPEDEFELRRQVRLLETRLVSLGKRVHRISLAECLQEAMSHEHALTEWFAAEEKQGTAKLVDTVHSVLSDPDYCPLVDLVTARLPTGADPTQDVVFVLRTGALFPVYRTFSLLEQLKGVLTVPAVLFYPGHLDSAAGLKFMGVLDAEHNYRPKIF
jgi:hypothetical protein